MTAAGAFSGIPPHAATVKGLIYIQEVKIMWYDPDHTLTHNALINMVIGPRGGGKTFGLKNKAVQNWVKKRKQFIYLRRYDTELQLVKENLFADLNREKGYEVQYQEGAYMLDGSVIGWPMALTKANSLKSASFPDVTLIIFDEFIVDEGQYQRYLTKEVDKFLNLYETVARMREDVRAFLLANSLSFINPYSLYWNLKNNGKPIVKDKTGLVLCELWQDADYTNAKNKTKFGQLITGTEFGDMAVNNRFILDNNTFIEPRPPQSSYFCGIILSGRKYGLWYELGVYYVAQGFDQDAIKFTFDVDDHTEQTLLEKHPRPLSDFFRAFKIGNVRFYSQAAKADFLHLFRRYY